MARILVYFWWFVGAAIGHYLLGLDVHNAFTVSGIGVLIELLCEVSKK